VLILAGIYALYYFKIWPFKENVAGIEYLTEKYCGKKDAPRETAICDCIVRSAEMDIKNRFSEKEYAEIQENRARSAYALHKSLNAIRPDMERCLREQGQEGTWDQNVDHLKTALVVTPGKYLDGCYGNGNAATKIAENIFKFLFDLY
jgi:hypothetical protein